jgi:serine/threonine protein kinase
MSDPLISQTIGQYEIVERLGRGGMSTVYRAHQLNMQRDVAIKVMSADLAGDPQFIARFEREAQMIANLEHPRILPVHDFGHEGELFYLVMRLIEGNSLYHRLLGGALPLATAGKYLSQIAEALDYAHAQGVVHRDLKPNNILIDEWDNLYLMDFGLAKMLASSQNLTASGAVLGTPAYMAPEQWRGETVDRRADIYALGVILYEMVVGHVPFESDTPYTLMYKHLNDPPPPPRDRLPDLPEDVEEVILHGLAKDPDDRFPTAGALARTFGAALNAAGVEEGDAPHPVESKAPPKPAESVPQPAMIIPPPDEIKPPDLGEGAPPVPSAVSRVPPRSIPVPKGESPPHPPRTPSPPYSSDQPDARNVLERMKSSPTFQQAMVAMESVIEAGLEKAAESAPVEESGVLGAIEPVSARPLNPPIFGQMRGLMPPDEPLIGVLDVRGTVEWQIWKYLLVGGLAFSVLGGIAGAGVLSTIGLIAWLYVFVQGIRTWRGQIGRFYLGFTPRRVILLPRNSEGVLLFDRAQSADWAVVDRLRMTDRYFVFDAPAETGRGLHFGALVLPQGEGGLGHQYKWLPGSPITALIDEKGFEVRNL